MNNNRTWHEEDHPRDDDGKFTYKNGGRYSSGIIFEKDNNRNDIPYPNNKEKNTSDNNSNKGNIFKIIYPIVLDLLKQYLLSNNKEEKTQIINNINKHIIYSDKDNKNDDIKLNTNNVKSTNTRNNKTISKETKSNSIDKINNPNKLKLGFGVLQPKKQKNIEDILYPTMTDKEPIIKNNKYKGIELLDTTKIKERPIEDILYPTMRDIKKIEIPRKNAGDYETVGKYLNKFQENEDTNEPGSWIMPCQGKIGSKYKEQRTDHVHTGIDIVVPVGTPVRAIADGKVKAASGEISGYGNAVYIEHKAQNGKIVRSEYGHLSEYYVKKDQQVKKGQIIALSGGKKGAPGSGVSRGPHLHLTIREFDVNSGTWKHVDPFIYIDN